MFTPWETACVLPESFDPKSDVLSELLFDGEESDKEYPVEMRRMHSIIDPDCYRRLTEALGMDLPEQRLAVPRFQIADGKDEGKMGRADRDNPPELSQQEVKSILEEVARRAKRRKKVSPKYLSIRVDGKEMARVDVSSEDRVSFKVGASAEIVKVCAVDDEGEITLAVHVLGYHESSDGDAQAYWIELEGGQKIRLLIKERIDRYGEYAGAGVEVWYQQARPVKAAKQYTREVKEVSRCDSKREEKQKWNWGGGLCRQLAFGKMSTDSVTGSGPILTKSPTFKPGEMRQAVGHARLYQHLFRGTASFQQSGNRLLGFADSAHAFRQIEIVREAAEILSNIPLYPYQSIGQFYLAWCERKNGHRATKILEKLAETAPPPSIALALCTFWQP